MPRRRITKAKIKHISLCPRGMNQMPVLYKEDGSVSFDTLIKADMEQGLITAIVAVPDRPDKEGDIISKEVIQDAAYEFAKSGAGVDIRHDNQTLPRERAFVAENFIIAKGDERFSDIKDYNGERVDVTGGWAVVIKVDDAELRRQYKDGKWNGVSMGGTGELEVVKQDDDEGLLRKFLKMLRGDPQGDPDMKPEELQKAFDENNANIAKAVTTGVTEALTAAGIIKKADDDKNKAKEPESKKPAAPIFKGDMASEEDRKQHRKALAIWKAETTIEDPLERFDAIEKIEAEFSEDTSDLDAEAGIEKSDSPEVKTLKRQLAKAQKASNQKTSGDRGDDTTAPDNGGSFGISKEDRDLFTAGSKSARQWSGIDDKKTA